MPALIGSPECILGARSIALLPEQQTELERGTGMAALISQSERVLGTDEIALLREEPSEPERSGATMWILVAHRGGRRLAVFSRGRIRWRLFRARIGVPAIATWLCRCGSQAAAGAPAPEPQRRCQHGQHQTRQDDQPRDQ
jgi:hypothetical protein